MLRRLVRKARRDASSGAPMPPAPELFAVDLLITPNWSIISPEGGVFLIPIGVIEARPASSLSMNVTSPELTSFFRLDGHSLVELMDKGWCRLRLDGRRSSGRREPALVEEWCEIAGDDLPCSEVSMDKSEFRKALSGFATGVTIVTTCDHRGRFRAMTVNSFTSVSLDPPLVLYCLGKSAFHFSAFAKAETFAINVLRADQQALSNRFAREHIDDLADLRVECLSTGSPILAEHLAALDCTAHARHNAGDHVIILGRVRAISGGPKYDPLLYFGSQYSSLRPLADD